MMSEIDTSSSPHQENIPGKTPEEQALWKIEVKRRYSHPFVEFTWEKVQEKHGKGKEINNHLIIENGNTRKIFNSKGQEIRHEIYRRTNPDISPSSPDLIFWENYEYDDLGYLIKVSAMSFGRFIQAKPGHVIRPGYVIKIEYQAKNEIRVPVKIITQPVDRQGFMDLGRPIGEPEIIDLTDTPLFAPASSEELIPEVSEDYTQQQQ